MIGALEAAPSVVECLQDRQETVVVAAAATLHNLQSEATLQAMHPALMLPTLRTMMTFLHYLLVSPYLLTLPTRPTLTHTL